MDSLRPHERCFVYLAIPYTSDPEANVEESIRISNILVERGFIPFNPLLYHFWHIRTPQPYETWMTLDHAFIERCNVVLRWPGESPGADRDVALGKELGMPVVYSLEALEEFRRSPSDLEDDEWESQLRHPTSCG